MLAAARRVLLGIECHLTCDMLLVADTGDTTIELLFNLKMIIFFKISFEKCIITNIFQYFEFPNESLIVEKCGPH